jgi:competence protein ComEA
MRVLLLALAAGNFLLAADDVVLPDGKAKTLIENTCTECHGLDTVVSSPMTSDKWRATVQTMVRKGATLSPEEIDTVVDYLSVYFSPDKVNVNTAGPDELRAALQITADEAKMILEYRKAHGNFKDLDALRKVTGLDPKKIDAKKDSIAF